MVGSMLDALLLISYLPLSTRIQTLFDLVDRRGGFGPALGLDLVQNLLGLLAECLGV